MLKVSFIQVVKKNNCPLLPQKRGHLQTHPHEMERFPSLKPDIVSVFPVHSRTKRVSTCCASQLCAAQAAPLLTAEVDSGTFNGSQSGTGFNKGD